MIRETAVFVSAHFWYVWYMECSYVLPFFGCNNMASNRQELACIGKLAHSGACEIKACLQEQGP